MDHTQLWYHGRLQGGGKRGHLPPPPLEFKNYAPPPPKDNLTRKMKNKLNQGGPHIVGEETDLVGEGGGGGAHIVCKETDRWGHIYRVCQKKERHFKHTYYIIIYNIRKAHYSQINVL